MKRRSRMINSLVLIILITGTMQVYRYIAIMKADAIVQIGYRGWENMFHTPYEYYAIGSGAFCRMSKWTVEKRFGKDAEGRRIYDDTENFYWRVYLRYSENSDFNSFTELYLKTSFGEQYRLSYRDAQYDGNLPDAAALQVILETTEKICGEYLNDGGTPYTDSFLFIQHHEYF